MYVKLLIAACAAAASTAAIAAGPLDQMKGKMKPGLYDMKMDMEIPGMPGGMGKQSMNTQNCVTEQDIEKGAMGSESSKDQQCDVKNAKVSGNSASYTVTCTGKTAMTADININFRDNGYTMNNKSTLNQGGQAMTMTQKIDARYLGPCKK